MAARGRTEEEQDHGGPLIPKLPLHSPDATPVVNVTSGTGHRLQRIALSQQDRGQQYEDGERQSHGAAGTCASA